MEMAFQKLFRKKSQKINKMKTVLMKRKIRTRTMISSLNDLFKALTWLESF